MRRFSRLTLLLISSLAMAAPVLVSATPRAEPLSTRDFFFDLLPEKDLNKGQIGLNAFFNDNRFGTIAQQMSEVRSTLGIRTIRVLFAWNDDVQPSPGSRINFSFYDDIIRAVPRGTNVLVILTGIPTWMKNSSQWDNGDPRATVIRRWVRPVVRRYRRNKSIYGWQLWNEPNDTNNGDNHTLQFVDQPENFISFVASANSAIKRLDRKQRTVSGATTAINQNYPETLDYNQSLIEGGIESHVNIYAFHYYGEQIERVLFPGGVSEVLNSVRKPLWMTESGKQGVEGQEEYVRKLWPFLRENIPGIRKTFYYQFTDGTGSDITYGLRNPTAGRGYSDLYHYLRGLR